MKTLLAFLLLASVAHAGSIVEIRQTAPDENGQVKGHLWSGTIVSWNKVLTCAHNYNEKYPVEVLLGRNQWAKGKILVLDPDVDLGLIEVEVGRVNLKPIPLAATIDETGEGTLAGFGHRVYRERKTRYWIRGEFIFTEAMVRHGDSGGAFLVNGKLAGVSILTFRKKEKDGAKDGNEQHGYCVPIEKIHDFLVEKAGWVRK